MYFLQQVKIARQQHKQQHINTTIGKATVLISNIDSLSPPKPNMPPKSILSPKPKFPSILSVSPVAMANIPNRRATHTMHAQQRTQNSFTNDGFFFFLSFAPVGALASEDPLPFFFFMHFIMTAMQIQQHTKPTTIGKIEKPSLSSGMIESTNSASANAWPFLPMTVCRPCCTSADSPKYISESAHTKEKRMNERMIRKTFVEKKKN